ncbi:hypothetical protein SCUCBS95973_002883 [Sporothrix curviconia]|uniref:Cytochrome P450 monooxygenase n=1 Tax=Sporothrix curviconia TaxID=1260050 RepID=A0ABP0BAS1_9PEZI
MLDALAQLPRPSMATAACVLAALVVVYAGAWIVYTRFFHPLARYPGPFWASVSRFWLVNQIRAAHADETQRALHAQLGPIVRIAPNEVAIADPEAIKTIYGINSGFTKTDFYTPWRPAWCRYPDAFTHLDESLHASRRRITNNLYSMSSIARAEESIDVCTQVLLDKMHSFAASGATFDMAGWAQMYAFDVIGQLFFSRMFGFLAAGHDHRGYIRSLDLLLPILCAASVMPTYLRNAFLVGGALVQPRVLKAMTSLQDIDRAAEQCIAERHAQLEAGNAAGQDDKKDILASLFATMRDKGDKVDFGRTEVKVEVYVALFAGSDTTAAAVSSVLYHLMKAPAVYDRLTAEIDEATAAGRLSTPIQYKEAAANAAAAGLPYLDACIKEGMRLHPSVGLTLPRHVPAGGCEIAGAWFPAGTRVGVNAAVVHRNRDIFGADADIFNPDRWFRADAARMDRYMFQISLCEMYKMIPELLRAYRLELVHPERAWTTHNYWFNKPSNVETRVTARSR